MKTQVSRRTALKAGVAITALTLLEQSWAMLQAATIDDGAEVIPFLDPQLANPTRRMVLWHELSEWITPAKDFFAVNHYGVPNVDLENWTLQVTGLVKKPRTFTLAELKKRKRQTVTATLECSGNGASPTFMGAIGNAHWTGTPLSSLLKDCGLEKDAIEVVFFGADEKTEKIREHDYKQNFARSLSLNDAFRHEVILAYEMNGQPLPNGHGAPLRLIVPGWYGIAWVKWITRIELRDRRYMSRFMARDYVTIRGEEVDGKTIWRETSVSKMNVKSLLGRVLRLKNGDVRITGAAWTDGTPLKAVEVKIDDGPWQLAHIDRTKEKYSWSFWSYYWPNPPKGEHTIVCRATDAKGHVQPQITDPEIALKKTYWEANQQYPRRIKI